MTLSTIKHTMKRLNEKLAARSNHSHMGTAFGDLKTVSWLQCPHALWFRNLLNFHVNNFVSMAITGSGYKNLSCISWPRWKRGKTAVVMKASHQECLSIFHVWTKAKLQSSGGPLSLLERLDSWEVEIFLFLCSGLAIDALGSPTLTSLWVLRWVIPHLSPLWSA